MHASSVPPLAKRVAHFGSRTIGRVSARHRMTPAFLIAGGQRCGTTSLYRALAQHPAILKAVLHKGRALLRHRLRPRPWAGTCAHFPLPRTARTVEERTGVPAVTVESSPVLHVPPAGRRADRRRPARGELIVPAARPGGAGLLGSTPTRWPAATRPSAIREGAGPGGRSGWPARRSGCSPTRRTTATPTSTTPTWPAAGTSTSSTGSEELVGRDRIHVVDSAEFFTDPEPVFRGVLRLPRPAAARRDPVRAAQRPAALGAHAGRGAPGS